MKGQGFVIVIQHLHVRMENIFSCCCMYALLKEILKLTASVFNDVRVFNDVQWGPNESLHKVLLDQTKQFSITLILLILNDYLYFRF